MKTLQWVPAEKFEEVPRPRKFIVWPGATVLVFLLVACSHLGEVKSAEAAASTAKTNLWNAKAAVDAQASDYAQEIAYNTSLMPASAYATVNKEISTLMVRLLGPGRMTAAKRQDFVQKLLKLDLDSNRLLFQAGKQADELNAKVTSLNQVLAIKDAQLKTLAEASATVADKADSVIHWMIAGVVVLALIFGLFVFIKFSEAAATVAAKVP